MLKYNTYAVTLLEIFAVLLYTGIINFIYTSTFTKFIILRNFRILVFTKFLFLVAGHKMHFINY